MIFIKYTYMRKKKKIRFFFCNYLELEIKIVSSLITWLVEMLGSGESGKEESFHWEETTC